MVGNLRLHPENHTITHISVQKDASLSEIGGSVHDTMRYGWRNVEAGSRHTHPVQSIQDHWQETEDQLHYDLLKYAFGTHMPLRLQMERAIVGQASLLYRGAKALVEFSILSWRSSWIYVTFPLDKALTNPAKLFYSR